MSRPPLFPLVLAALAPLGAGIAAAPASAARTHFHAEQAFRKGLRVMVRSEAPGARLSKVRIHCVEVPKVDDRGRCTGTFDLTRGGRTAHYGLTPKAATFRVSRGAIEYDVYSRAEKRVRGLPMRPGILGFLQ